jgi:hypothetical protein
MWNLLVALAFLRVWIRIIRQVIKMWQNIAMYLYIICLIFPQNIRKIPSGNVLANRSSVELLMHSIDTLPLLRRVPTYKIDGYEF